MARILAVDDDADLCSLLKRALEKDGHEVATLMRAEEVQERHCRWADCMILDVMMPGEDGFALCRRIRERSDCPILFLTAKTEEDAVILGLGLGADDYLSKPFRIGELRARVNAHLRREKRTPHNRIVRGNVTLDLTEKAIYVRADRMAAGKAEAGNDPERDERAMAESGSVVKAEQLLRFTRGEYEICEYLALHAGQIFSREQIYEAVFGYDGEADSSAVTEHIKNIRAKLRSAGLEPIETVWGIGYKWKGE